MTTFSNSASPNTRLSTQAQGSDEKEAKQSFQRANPKAVIIEFKKIAD